MIDKHWVFMVYLVGFNAAGMIRVDVTSSDAPCPSCRCDWKLSVAKLAEESQPQLRTIRASRRGKKMLSSSRDKK